MVYLSPRIGIVQRRIIRKGQPKQDGSYIFLTILRHRAGHDSPPGFFPVSSPDIRASAALGTQTVHERIIKKRQPKQDGSYIFLTIRLPLARHDSPPRTAPAL